MIQGNKQLKDPGIISYLTAVKIMNVRFWKCLCYVLSVYKFFLPRETFSLDFHVFF